VGFSRNQVHRSSVAPYRLEEVIQVWRKNRTPGPMTIPRYVSWLRRFALYCQSCDLDQRTELTQLGARRFAHWWRSKGSRRHGRLNVTARLSHSALHAVAFALAALGESMPQWSPPKGPPIPDRFQAFADYLRAVRGNGDHTIRMKIRILTAFECYRQFLDRADSPISLTDIDSYITSCRRRFSRKTVVLTCSAIRAYLRFLHVTRKMNVDLSASVLAPTVRPAERPYRGLPWTDVQKILHAVNRTHSMGRRDYALLLMMSVYGLGAGEVIRLRLDDVNWQMGTIHVVRAKTGAEYFLPLLPAVARSLADYLMRGRPPHAIDREIFLGVRSPFARLGAATAVGQILHKAAQRAGVTAPFLGTHVLRHAHATMELDLGAPLKVIGDILGHRNPESTSVYARVASEHLREISMPVPT
jgi:integrase/recombinase XerD